MTHNFDQVRDQMAVVSDRVIEIIMEHIKKTPTNTVGEKLEYFYQMVVFYNAVFNHRAIEHIEHVYLSWSENGDRQGGD